MHILICMIHTNTIHTNTHTYIQAYINMYDTHKHTHIHTCSSFLGTEEAKKEEDVKKVAGNETINIFSIASGHLYERFLRYYFINVRECLSHLALSCLIKNHDAECPETH